MTTTLLSIIMPCYNEANGVGRTLDALEQLRVRLAAQLVRIELHVGVLEHHELPGHVIAPGADR